MIRNSASDAAWEAWMRDHAAKLLLFARQQTRCEADAHDVFQEAVTEIWRRNDGSPPGLPQVVSTIKRRAIDLGRREDRRSRREEAAAQDEELEWFDARAEDIEMGRLVQAALKDLSEMQREVIVLKVWGGMTFAEIAEALETPANTVASRYRNGLMELRKLTKEVLA